jgi:uncharacterized protein (DUF608 family)
MVATLFARPASAASDPVNFTPNVYQGYVSLGWTLAGTGDFDGNGNADLLWFNAATRTATVWSSTGANFTPNTFQASVGSGWSIAGVGDFDGDGKADLVWKNGNTITIWTSIWTSSGGGFLQNTYVGSVASGWTLTGIGDFDGDRKSDLLWFNSGTNTFTIWTSNGTGGFQQNTYVDSVTSGWVLAGTGDFDGDGKDDLAWFNSAINTFTVWISKGSNGFQRNASQGSVTSGWRVAAIRDFNGDGRKDLLWQNGGAFAVWTSTVTGFTPNSYQGVVSGGWALAGTGDFNGDGRSDLIWMNGTTFTEWQSKPPTSNKLPVGALDPGGICSAMTGWSIDPDTAGLPVTVDVYVDGEYGKGGTLLLEMPANQYRADHCSGGTCNHGFIFGMPAQYQDGKAHTLYAYAIDTNPQVGGSQLDLLSASPKSFQCSTGVTPIGDLYARGATRVYSGAYLTGIEFPVGPVGSGGILHFGDGTRNEGWIVNGLSPDTFQPRNQGIIPNSFFAVRVQPNSGSALVRALQTTPVGKFSPMQSLTFTGEYPIATYHFIDAALPIAVTETVLSPMIPGDLKNSAIPTAIYQFKITNTGTTSAQVSLLATQQNAVGYDGKSVVEGPNQDTFSGYGANTNTVTSINGSTRIAMTKASSLGSIVLDMPSSATSATASWNDIGALYNYFALYGGAINATVSTAQSAPGATNDAAVAGSVTLAPGQSVTIPVVLSWHFPANSNYFSTANSANTGMHYETVWTDASAVDQYVVSNLTSLLANTQLYHDTLYDSTLPQYLLDRISSSPAVLHTPVVFWAKNGFFGGWEGLGCCANMPNHVWQYAQAPARLWPEIGTTWDGQWFADIGSDGSVPTRIDQPGLITFDGQAGNILMAYRDFLNTGNTQWLSDNWARIKPAMDYLITTFDPGCTGVLEGNSLTTLDTTLPTANPWLGSLYLAAVNATSHMAAALSSGGKPPCSDSNKTYSAIYSNGQTNQEAAFWNGSYYVENAPNSEGPQCVLGNASEIDMLLGQWWSSQLGLGDLYDSGHMTTALASLYRNNHKDSNVGFSSVYAYRDFVEDTDASMQMATWPNGDRPGNALWYYDETMTGFEYAAAATMIQRGLLDQGLRVVLDVSNRYDGRLRADRYLSPRWDESVLFGFESAGGWCVGICDGTGNPFGDDEAGKWYGRSMSSWSLLLAAQGFSDNLADGVRSITFAPTLSPDNHRSLFTASNTWGTFQQTRSSGRQTDQIAPKFGSLTLQTVNLVIPPGNRVSSASIVANGTAITPQVSPSGNSVRVSFPTTVIPSGTTLAITLNLGR